MAAPEDKLKDRVLESYVTARNIFFQWVIKWFNSDPTVSEMLIIDYSLDMFRAFLCPSSGEKTTCYYIWSICAGSVGCGRLRYCGATCHIQHYQQIYPICSNKWSFLLMMGIKMPETCRGCSQ